MKLASVPSVAAPSLETVTVQSLSSMVNTVESCAPTVTQDGSRDASISTRKVSSPSHRASSSIPMSMELTVKPFAANVAVAFPT